MSRDLKIPRCLACGKKPVHSNDDFFCSDKCGFDWAMEQLGGADEIAWCAKCRNWVGLEFAPLNPMDCPHGVISGDDDY